MTNYEKIKAMSVEEMAEFILSCSFFMMLTLVDDIVNDGIYIGLAD